MARQAHRGRLFETRNDLDAGTRTRVIEVLNRSLADTTDLTMQVKHAHWNVKGPRFQPLHGLFDEQAALLAEHADLLAERATALGGHAMGTARMAADVSRIAEFPAEAVGGEACVEALADRFASHAGSLRSAIETAEEAGDLGTADLFTELSRDVDKQLWFLESHVQDRTAVESEGVTVPVEDD